MVFGQIVSALSATTTPSLASGLTDFMSVVNTVMDTIKGDGFLIIYLVAPAFGIAVSAVRKLVGRM